MNIAYVEIIPETNTPRKEEFLGYFQVFWLSYFPYPLHLWAKNWDFVLACEVDSTSNRHFRDVKRRFLRETNERETSCVFERSPARAAHGNVDEGKFLKTT